MFVQTRRLKTQGAVALATSALALVACSDPTARTDLRPDGPPEVLSVLVLNDSVNGLVEKPTYCKPNDEKVPTLVGLPDFTTTQICPDDLSAVPMLADASPDTFYVRIMFDELLDPNIEDLTEILDENDQPTGSYTGSIARSQPVKLECKGVDNMFHDVPYDGYYAPSGNNVTWPLGPSLVIKQLGDFIIPTNSACQITLKENITDKQGIPVPADQRGPFPFKVAGIKALVIDPSDDSKVDALALASDNVYVQFNTAVDEASFCDEGAAMDECEFAFTPDLGGVGPGSAYSLAPFGLTPAEFGFAPTDVPMVDTMYTFAFTGGKIKDQCGVETTLSPGTVADNTKITVTTNPWKLNSIIPSNNDTIAPNRKVRLNFSNVVDSSSLLPTEFSLTPTVANLAFSTTTLGDIFFAGNYQPNTEYTLTLNAGATIEDANGASLTVPEARVVKFKTQPIALTSSTPANGSTVTKATPTSSTSVTFSFNQSMDLTTFTADDIEFTGAATTLTFTKTSASSCTAGSSSCGLVVRGVYTPGDYQVKLKAGAVIKDVLGNDYTQAADRIVRFTVKESTPSTPTPCLGE